MIRLEDAYKTLYDAHPESEGLGCLYKSAATLTKFLRSGRLLSATKKADKTND